MRVSINRVFLVLFGGALALAFGASQATAQGGPGGPLPLSAIPPEVLQDVRPELSDGMWIVNPDGFVIARSLVDEANEDPFTIYGIPGAGDPAVFGAYTILLEPDGRFSDIFGVADLGNGPTQLGFSSDQEGIPSPFESSIGGGAFQFVELPGLSGFWDATHYLNPAVYPPAVGFRAIFYSDIEPVPEPSTIVLCGLSALGLFVARRRIARV